jgi:hypothetical protein
MMECPSNPSASATSDGEISQNRCHPLLKAASAEPCRLLNLRLYAVTASTTCSPSAGEIGYRELVMNQGIGTRLHRIARVYQSVDGITDLLG